jgi:hypothetical protein
MSKLKQAIERWLRQIIREEVSNVDTDLRGERAVLLATIRACDEAFKTHIAAFDAALQRITEISYHSQENTKLRATIKEMDGHVAEICSIVQKL